MEATASRFYDMQKVHKPVEISGMPKNGQEFVIFHNKFGQRKISCILNWKNGFLNSDDNTPAVQMEDSHTEYWTNGYLDNTQRDKEGNLMPAVIADYGKKIEYWVNGKKTRNS